MKYFAIIDDEQKGPFELSQLAEAGVRPDTYVWCKGMSDWQQAKDVADICRMFRIRIHDLMHPGSGGDSHTPDSNIKETTEPDKADTPPQWTDEKGRTPSRFDRYLSDSDEPRLPSLEEIEEREAGNTPPTSSLLLPAILVTILCFPPTGVVAICQSIKARKCRREADSDGEREHARSAKMWTGISLFLGLILYAFLVRFF